MLTLENEPGDLTKDGEITRLRTAQGKSVEERKDPLLKISRSGDFKVEDTVAASSNRSRLEDSLEELRKLPSEL
jgi:hypothetical protein